MRPPRRCEWAEGDDELLREYHDTEWGVPVHDDRLLYEKLVLDGAQAGLSWSTILRKRPGYLRAFDGLRPEKVARYGERQVARLLRDPGIVRNRAKVRSAIANARAFLAVQGEHGSFDRYLWAFVDGEPRRNHWRRRADIPAESPLSRALSRDLKTRGFSFVGPTIVYAFMQAVGMVNDHLVGCFRYREV
jgi:DNA-3-methyladenine glycosylase I